MQQTWILCVLAAIWAIAVGEIHHWKYDEFPDPQSYDTYSLCRRSNLSNVCDPDGIISREDADRLDGLIESIRLDTRCSCQHCDDYSHGFLIRVAIMPRMHHILQVDDGSGVDLLKNLEDARLYAYLLSQEWSMTGFCGESILVLYSRYDGILYTMTREVAREKLQDRYVKRITLAVRPYFDDPDRVADGLYELIARYKEVLDDKPEKGLRPRTASQRSNGASGVVPPVVTLLLTSLIMLFRH